ncbi:MAG: ATP-binding protein [Pseudomonadota bacterium]
MTVKQQISKEYGPGSATGSSDSLMNTRAYFRQLRWRLGLGIFLCFIIPHAILSAYFHFQFTATLKTTGKLNLEALAKSQRNTVALFLREREMNIRNLVFTREFSLDPSEATMLFFLQRLKQISDAFVDVGFLGAQGIQTGYAGPFPQLRGKDYRHEAWFTTLVEQDRDYIITDIYMGFRNQPHFTIAVKQVVTNQLCIMRATIDPDKFYMFLRSISRGREVETTLINSSGTYQIVDPHKGTLLGASSFLPPTGQESGVLEMGSPGGTVLTAYAWLAETGWTLIISQPLSIVHAQMYRTRTIMIINQFIIIVVLAMVIWLMVSRLVSKAREAAEQTHMLQKQLIHASKLASVGELATGIAHEINNPLAIITSTTGVIRDMLNPEFHLDSSPEDIGKELDTIETAAFRASGITHQLLDFGRNNEPRKTMCNLNDLLASVINGMKKHQLNLSDIEVITSYDESLPATCVDGDQITQVFLNLINNAGDAITGKGTITVTTGVEPGYVKVMVQDTGSGMTSDQIKRIFDPFYTTKEAGKGTGLGLSISLSIVDAMDGSIEVQSLPGKGSLFTVSLPITQCRDAGSQEIRS